MRPREIKLLMWHSISDGNSPIFTSPDTFRAQLDLLEENGYHLISMAAFSSWLNGSDTLPPRCAVATFDDGYADFADVAFPELRRRGWSATVFLPTGHVGGYNDWEIAGATDRRRPLLTWNTITQLVQEGVAFGAHGVWHRDLRALPTTAALREIRDSQRTIEDQTGHHVSTFAFPYGKTRPLLLGALRAHYRCAVGTRLASARRTSARYDLPRIDMYYFRRSSRWQSSLSGGASFYTTLRRALRGARAFLPG